MTSDDLFRDIDSDDLFRDKWKPLPEQDKECLSDRQLLAYAKKPQTDWPAHLHSCKQCGEVIGLLVDPSPPRRLHEFLSMARENALKVAPERPSSVLTYLKAFLSGMQPRWVVLTSAALVLMLGFFFWSYKREVASGQDQIASVSFDKDNYPQTVALLQKLLQEVRSAPLTLDERQNRVKELNEKLSELKKQKLNQEQYGKLTDLVTRYKYELVSQASGRPNSKTPGDDTKLPEIIQGDESKTVAKLYVTIDQVVSNKPNDSNHALLSEKETAAAVRSASEEFEIKSISPEEKEIVMEDRMPDRPEQQRQMIQDRFAFTNGENFKVKIVPLGYKSGAAPVSFNSPTH